MRFRWIEKRVSSMAEEGFPSRQGYVELEGQTDEGGLDASNRMDKG